MKKRLFLLPIATLLATVATNHEAKANIDTESASNNSLNNFLSKKITKESTKSSFRANGNDYDFILKHNEQGDLMAYHSSHSSHASHASHSSHSSHASGM